MRWFACFHSGPTVGGDAVVVPAVSLERLLTSETKFSRPPRARVACYIDQSICRVIHVEAFALEKQEARKETSVA